MPVELTSAPSAVRDMRAGFPDGSVTIVMPVHNAATTLPEVFDGLERQENRALVERVLLIDDCSSDGSQALLRDYARRASYAVEVVVHDRNRGIARTFKDGLGRAQTDIVVFMQADMQLTDAASIGRLISPLATDPSIVGAYAAQLHPLEVWRSYPFWQRCMFARFVDRQVRLFTPKFAALRRRDLIQLGVFDGETFRVAGEDGDLHRRAERQGFRIVPAPVAAVHLHSRDPHFGLRDWVRKEAQYAEAQGALLRRFGVRSPRDFAFSFFRQLLLVGVATPISRRPAAVLTAAYAVLYTADVFRRGPVDARLLVLPLVNLSLLPIALIASLRGFARARQSL